MFENRKKTTKKIKGKSQTYAKRSEKPRFEKIKKEEKKKERKICR